MVRAEVAHALDQLGSRTPIRPLVKALDDEDATVRAAAVQALGKMEERTPTEVLVSALDDPEWLVREAAVLALGERIPIAALIKAAIHDKDETVREAAMTILQKIQPDRVPVTAQQMPSPSLLSTNGDTEQISYAQMQTTSLRARRKLLPYLIKIGLAALVVTGLILASLAIWYITHRSGKLRRNKDLA